MRVQLSPWEVTETSFHLPTNKRRRQRSSSQTSESPASQVGCHSSSSSLVASFIDHQSSFLRSSRRKRKKAEKSRGWLDASSSEDRLPVLALTSAHRIGVLVGGETNRAFSSRPGLQESSILQFTSRPSKATAYLPDNSNDDSLDYVPALFDAHLSRIYALQGNNTKLISYSAVAGNTEDVENDAAYVSSFVTLEQAARDLALLHLPRVSSTATSCPRTLVYGTLSDGRVFVAHSNPSSKNEELVVTYIQSLELASSGDYVGISAHVVPPATTTGGTSSRKRKDRSSSALLPEHSLDVFIHQIFRQDRGLQVIRLNVQIAASQDNNKTSSSWISTAALRRQESKIDLTDSIAQKVTDVVFLGLSGTKDALSLAYKTSLTVSVTSNGKKNHPPILNPSLSFALISLQMGHLVGCPLHLSSSNVKQVALMGPSLLAGLTSDGQVVLFDTLRGGRLGTYRLPFAEELNHEVKLVADSKRFRLAVIFSQQDKYTVAYASVVGGDSVGLHPSLPKDAPLPLAAGLASSVTGGVELPRGNTRSFSLNKEKWDHHEYDRQNKALQKGLGLLVDVCKSILDNTTDGSAPFLLRNTFDKSVEITFSWRLPTGSERRFDNPQDPIRNGKWVNGMSASPGRSLRGSGGEQGKRKTQLAASSRQTSSLPQAFIEGASMLIVNFLCSLGAVQGARNDARYILRRLIRSKMVSARTHLMPGSEYVFLDLLRALESREQEEGISSAYNPFEFSIDILSCTHDVAESQMISILHYTMSRAQPGDISSYFTRDKRFDSKHPIHRQIQMLQSLESKSDCSEEEKQTISSHRRRLIITGVTVLLQKTLTYSECNSALLRNALETQLDDSEIKLLTQILMKMIRLPEDVGMSKDGGNFRRVMHWLTALLDCGIDLYAQDGALSEKIRNFVSFESRLSKLSVPLHAELDELLQVSDSSEKGRSKKPPKLKKKSSESILPYQIERLVF